MANITYLLGAGASAKTMPVVSSMSAEIQETMKWVEQYRNAVKRGVANVPLDFAKVLQRLGNLKTLCDPETNFSIDTYAKKLFHKRKFQDSKQLKQDISLFFLLRQKHKGIDLRYDNFWASILTGNNLPSNIKVLSWNYDNQLELSFQDFIDNPSLENTASVLNIKNPTEIVADDVANQFCVFKLNGSATVRKTNRVTDSYLIDNIRGVNDLAFFNLMSPIDVLESSGFETMVSFAWENRHTPYFNDQLKGAIKKTEVLVVIGYSFPYFNRSIDKMLLSQPVMPGLSKIYIQDLEPELIKATINGLIDLKPRDIIVDTIESTNQFFLPFEL